MAYFMQKYSAEAGARWAGWGGGVNQKSRLSSHVYAAPSGIAPYLYMKSVLASTSQQSQLCNCNKHFLCQGEDGISVRYAVSYKAYI